VHFRLLSQLGGIEIMASNGITHTVVDDDFEGALAILNWLAFAPATQTAPPALPLPPSVASSAVDSESSSESAALAAAASSTFTTSSLLAHYDSPLRDIATAPAAKKGDAGGGNSGNGNGASGVDDVRLLLAGHVSQNSQNGQGSGTSSGSGSTGSGQGSGSSGSQSGSEWVGGFFDRHSFTEYQAAWAPTVIVARARLGGVAVGAIAVETRSVEVLTPADPAAADRCDLQNERTKDKHNERKEKHAESE
jgi:hypothetical protein